MKYPTLQETSPSKSTSVNFGGLNEKLSCAEGEFSELYGIMGNDYPVLTTRSRLYDSPLLPTHFDMNYGHCLKDGVFLWGKGDQDQGGDVYVYENQNSEQQVTGHKLSDDIGSLLTETTGCRYTLQKDSMGKYIFFLPNVANNSPVYYDTETHSADVWGASVEISGAAFSICDADGKYITPKDESYYEQNPPSDGDYKKTTTGEIYRWSASYSTWMAVTSTKVQVRGSFGDFSKGDGVRMTIDEETYRLWPQASNIFVNQGDDGDMYADVVLATAGESYASFTGLITVGYTLPAGKKLKVERRIPDLKFITECNNRLWGCSYDGHEVYCSKLGDFKNWYCYEGISTDSWAATVGSDEAFTGVASINGNVYFFKERTIIKIIPSSSGAHVKTEYKLRGVVRGGENSVITYQNSIYYLSPDGFCAYDGSFPTIISDKFSTRATYISGSAVYNERIYFATIEDSTANRMLIFDLKTGMWFVGNIDQYDVLSMYTAYSVDEDRPVLFVNTSYGNYRYEGGIGTYLAHYDSDWYAVTGLYGYTSPDHKYISRLNLTLSIEHGALFSIYIKYDNDDTWTHVKTIRGTGMHSFNVPVLPKRCEHFRLKFSGKGKCHLYSLTKTTEGGSDT